MNKHRLTKRVLPALTGWLLEHFLSCSARWHTTVGLQYITLAPHLELRNPCSRNNFVHIPRFHHYVYYDVIGLIFNTLLFEDDQFIISDTEDNLEKAVCLLYNISKKYNLEIATKKTKVFRFVGTDHLRTKITINDETLEQVSQFTYLGCSISYQFSNDVEFKLANVLQLIGSIK